MLGRHTALSRRAALAAVGPSRRAFSQAAGLEKLWIFDTTLRDGEQSPGATLTGDEKVEISKQLARMGVDICEAGFPIASQGDFEAVTRVAQTAGHLTEGRPNEQTMRICGLARANEKDIERAYDAVRHAPLHRIHTFLASSDIHLDHKLNMTRAQCLEQSARMVAFAKCESALPTFERSPARAEQHRQPNTRQHASPRQHPCHRCACALGPVPSPACAVDLRTLPLLSKGLDLT